MTVNEFCAKYGMKPKTVYKRIAYNKNGKLAGHVVKEKGKPISFDGYAENFLKSVQVKIIELEDDVIRTVEENDNLKDKVCELEFDNSELKSAFDSSEKEVTELKANLEKNKTEISKLKAGIEERDNTISDLYSEVERLKSELETEKNKSIIEHLRGKGK